MRFGSRALNSLLGGWTFAGITTAQSGGPLTFVMGDDVALDGTGGSQHAMLAPGATVDTIRIDHASRAEFVNRFFNTSAFIPTNSVPRGVYGNAGRGLISGPARSNTDASLMKDFVFKEPLRLQFRSEFFNAFNQVNFSNPNVRVNSSAFGLITAAGDPRIIQLALKLIW